MPLIPILAALAPAIAVGGASYAASRFCSRYLALTIVIALVLVTPLGGVLAVRVANEHATGAMPSSGIAPYLILTAIVALWWLAIAWGWIKARRHRHWSASGREMAVVLGGFAAIAAAGWLAEKAMIVREVMRMRADQQRERVRQWHESERALRACAIEVGRASAERDAATALRGGDRRLLGIISVYQETSSFNVPGVDAPVDLGEIASAPAFVTGRIGTDPRRWRIAVRETPVGRSYTDPWGFARRAMGRDPDSAAACNAATQAYVSSYNAIILRAGVAKEPVPNTAAGR